MEEFKGVIVPLVTPISESGEIDKPSFKKLIRHVLDNGATGLMPTAGTGEGVGLSPRQRRSAVEICVEESQGKFPVIPGIILPGYGDCIETAKEYKKIGADGVMLLTPYYTSLACQDDLVDYFVKFLDHTEIPLMIENLPSRTGINMLPETMRKLSDKSPLFVAIKECVLDPMQFTELIHLVGQKISVLCGFESMMSTAFLLGASGGVIATANIFPQIYAKMLREAKRQDLQAVNKINNDLIRPLNSIIYASPNPGPIRVALRHIGIETGKSIPPVHEPSVEVKQRLIPILDKIEQYIKNHDL